MQLYSYEASTQALDHDTGRYSATTAPVLLYAIRTIIRVSRRVQTHSQYSDDTKLFL